MIFDIHCHILPEVDDGARNRESTARMLKLAGEEGIDAIVATPHFSCDTEAVSVQELKKKYYEVQRHWKRMGRQKELYLGNELYYSEGVVEALEQGLALTMNGTAYVLVEFAEYSAFSDIRRAIQKLLYAGYIPIIAHMERYEQLQKKERVLELVEMGAYIQSNTAAIMGEYGFGRKRFLLKLLREGLIHFVATDAHGTTQRKPQMRECIIYLEKKLGAKMAHEILEDNPKKMLSGRKIGV